VIKPNLFPWNVRANILNIDSPAGVGYSIANGTNDTVHNDVSTTEDAFAALQAFFRDYPELKGNELWVTGESYAGIYSPYLALRIHHWNQAQEMVGGETMNLQGFIVGNGMTDMYIDSDNVLLESVANWGMIPLPLWTKMNELGCLFLWEKVPVTPDNDPQCAGLYNQSMELIKDLDIYDLFRTQYTI